MRGNKFQRVAQRHLPIGTRVIYARPWRTKEVFFAHPSYRGQKTIRAPEPACAWSLYYWLHECAHLQLKHWSTNDPPHVFEFEACLQARTWMRMAGISVPWKVLAWEKRYVRGHCRKDKRKGLKLRRHVIAWSEFDG